VAAVTIRRIAVAHPEIRLSQKEAARRIGIATGDPRRTAALARGTRIDQRALALPAFEIGRLGSMEARNRLYASLAPPLALEAARRALADDDVDFLVTTSCTGYMSPGWDVSLVEELPLSTDTPRLPITEAGCAGGVVAIARAADYLRSRPGGTALAVSTEICSLAFHADSEEGNLTSALIFGDGAGACVLDASEEPGAGLQVIDSASALVPEGRDALGFDLTDRGFYPLLTRALVGLLPGPTRSAVRRLLRRHGLDFGDVSFWLLHPGGSRIISGLEACLSLPLEKTHWSWDSMREFGNTSSAAIFDVMRRYLEDEAAPKGWGIVAAFGPGVSVELLLVRSC
jgi:alkylresorcinol/alkylpyrone synthase